MLPHSSLPVCQGNVISNQQLSSCLRLFQLVQVYNSQAKPVEDFFKEDGLLRSFEISGGIPETLPRLLQELGPFSYLLAERRAQAARNQLAKQMTWVSKQTQKVMSSSANGASAQSMAVASQSMGKCTAAGPSQPAGQQ